MLIFCIDLHASIWEKYFSISDSQKYDENFTHFSYVNPDAQKGGIIKYAMSGEFAQFNLFTGHLIKHAVIFDTLMRSAGDELSNYYPLIADKIMISDDYLSVIFHIDERAKWSNEESITVKDIFFSYDFFITNQYFIDNIDNVAIISDQEIKFFFINADLCKQTIDQIIQIPIISQKFYTNINNNFEFVLQNLPPFSGPYMIDDFCLGDFVQYKRNEFYWAKNLPVNKGRFNFDTIIYKYYYDPGVAAFSVANGDNDVRVEFVDSNWHFAYSKGFNLSELNFFNIINMHDILIKEEIDQTYVNREARFFIYNNKKPLFENINFRRSLNSLFNFKNVNKRIFNNSYVRLQTFFPGLHENSNNADESIMNNEEMDFAQILQLLHKANLKCINGQIVDHNNKQVEISILLFHVKQKRFIEQWVQNIEKIGIKVNLEIIDFAQYYRCICDSNFDITPYYFRYSNIYDINIIDFFHSQGRKNFAGINNRELDILLDLFYKENDLEKKINFLYKIDCFLLNHYFTMPQWTMNKLRLIYWNKFNRPITMTSQGKTDNINYLNHGFDTWWDKSI